MVLIITLVLLASLKNFYSNVSIFFAVASQIIQINQEKKGDPEGF